MPWTGASFKKKHNHSLTDDEAEKAASMANAILKETGDEAKAIRIANSHFQKQDDGELDWNTPRQKADRILKNKGYK